MNLSKGDTLTTRLVQTLLKLNNGEALCARELAEEFNVSVRTIQRDLKHFESLLLKEGNLYRLEPNSLGKLSLKNLQDFATLSGIGELFPSIDCNFIKNALKDPIYLVKNQGYENFTDTRLFNTLSLAIKNHHILTFNYAQKPRNAQPYKLINNYGVWYLLAEENNQLKNFTLSKISNLTISNEEFQPSQKLLEQIKHNKNLWFAQKESEAILQISSEAFAYFFRKPILSNYTILEKSDTNLILSTKFAYDDEILHLVQQWIPYITILSPQSLQDKLRKNLKQYLEQMTTK